MIKMAFDLDKSLEELEYPAMFVAGLIYYINSNNLKIKSDKDFDKAVNEFKKLKVGA